MVYPEKGITERLELAKILAVKAGKAVLKIQSDPNLVVRQKEEGLADLVTEGDELSQGVIIKAVTRRFPQDLIRSEELKDYRLSGNGFTWIIDPIDGTLGFRTRVEDWGVSIGVHFNGEPVAGVIYFPGFRKLYDAFKGGGAFRNGEQIYTPKEVQLRDMPFYFNAGYGRLKDFMEFEIPFHSIFRDKVQIIETPICATLAICRVAEGSGAHSYLHTYLSPYDLGAATLILEEAGGIVSKIDWNKPRQAVLMAANRGIYEEVFSVMGTDLIEKSQLKP